MHYSRNWSSSGLALLYCSSGGCSSCSSSNYSSSSGLVAAIVVAVVVAVVLVAVAVIVVVVVVAAVVVVVCVQCCVCYKLLMIVQVRSARRTWLRCRSCVKDIPHLNKVPSRDGWQLVILSCHSSRSLCRRLAVPMVSWLHHRIFIVCICEFCVFRKFWNFVWKHLCGLCNVIWTEPLVEISQNLSL